MQRKRWYRIMTAVITLLPLVILIPASGQTASSEQIVTVYKSPT